MYCSGFSTNLAKHFFSNIGNSEDSLVSENKSLCCLPKAYAILEIRLSYILTNSSY